MLRIEKYLGLAVEIARNSRERGWRFGAVVVEKKRIIGLGINKLNKTTPLAKGTHTETTHAEVAAILSCKRYNLKNSTLYVARINTQGIQDAKPCKNCMKIIKKNGIKNIVWTTSDGSCEYRRMKL